MKQVEYNPGTQELEIIFKKTETPGIVKLNNGAMLAYGEDFLSSIIFPQFFNAIRRPEKQDAKFEFENAELNGAKLTIKIKMDGQMINLNVDLSEIEKFK